MRKNWLLLLLAMMLVSLSDTAQAQRLKDKYRNKANDPISELPYYKKLRYADGLFRQGSYFNAIEYYQQLKQEQPRNPYLTYQLAECYYFTRDYVPAASNYGETYALASKIYPEAVYKEALMLKMQGRYDSAIGRFNKFIEDNPKTYKKLKKRALKDIDGARMGKNSINDPQPVTIKNAGPNVNSAYTESAPYPLGDTALLFSSMSQNKVVDVSKQNRGSYVSRFMTSQKQYRVEEVDSFQWPLPFTDGDFNDPKYHTGNGCFSPGGERFYFTRCKEEDSMQVICKIYVSNFDKTQWGTPKLLGEGINESGSNTQPFVAQLGKKEILFFSSNRKLQSRGGYDIWYSVIDPRRGTYRRPQNAGKQINTEGNEVTPYYDSRVNKLYFSSDGWISMGGFDVFSADGGPSRYRNITNLGYPINTSADELYYIKDPVGKPDAYLVSNRIGSIALKNPTCCDDIWRIQYEPNLVVNGQVVDCNTKKLRTNVVVKMVDEEGQIRTYTSEDGNFTFHTPRGHSYVFTADKEGFATLGRATVSTQNVMRTDADNTVMVEVCVDTVNLWGGFQVSNVYYDFDKATLKPESMASLDSLANFLRDNPALSVEIYAFTDSKGGDDYNKDLSLRRAESVRNYLTGVGVTGDRMIAKAWGERMPAKPNETQSGKDLPYNRALNRRTEFRIIKDDPARRVLYNSANRGTIDQQSKNLQIDENSNDDDGETDNESENARPGARVDGR